MTACVKIVLKKGVIIIDVAKEKLQEVLLSVIPIALIVIVLNFTLVPLDSQLFLRFIIGTVFIILGLVFFLIGVDLGITPLGNLVGTTIAKSNKILIIIVSGLVLGFFVSIAEPGLIVLSNQVDLVTAGQISSMSILIVVSIGLALLLTVGLLRILYNIKLNRMLSIIYLIVFILAIFTSPEFLAISFDASGATTGILAVPFILALASGVAKLKKDSTAAEEDSFGLVALASAGAIIGVMILSILKGHTEYTTIAYAIPESVSIIKSFIDNLPLVFRESIFSILPLLVIFIVLQKIAFKMNKKSFRRIVVGFIYSFIGLILFLLGVNVGFMDVGSMIGSTIASMENDIILVIVGFFLGVVTILAEPAVHVQTKQIEEVTSGYVNRKAVLFALSLGVGIAIALSMIRITVPGLKLWHYLLPGYIIAFTLSFIVPNLFVGIAFDAGGVATGPMTTTFILAFTQGAADAVGPASILIDGFGMIATVAMMPIISLQILGFVFHLKSKKGGIPDED